MSKMASNQKISLCGRWRFAFAEEGKWDERDVVSGKEAVEWLDCEVPGSAHLDLLKNSLIPDPFFGMNAEDIRKYEYYEWWYKRKFSIPPELCGKRLELLFHGLDTFAGVWLNGHFLGKSDNMFISHSFDVTDYINEYEKNELIVMFSSPRYAVLGRELSGCYAGMGTFESLWARKARHTYGWDIAPRLLTAGIWRKVELVGHDKYEIKNVFAGVAELHGRCATLAFHIDLDLPKSSWDNLKIVLHGECGTGSFDSECQVGSTRADMAVVLEDSKLWWPNGYGNPDLYNIKITLYRDGIPVHNIEDRIGIRTVGIDQEKDSFGNRNFIIKVNGIPIFCKGTNSVPMDAFHSRDMERIPEFINMVRETNCNMVRIWGGGVYEHDLFYDLCDEYGIMVMQDFMYACAIYPQDDEFLKTAEKEARIVVKSLRNHPSILVWCGDNEIDQAYYEWFNQTQSPENNKLARQILKDVCHGFDGTRPYMPSSPYSPTPGSDPNSEFEGDRHLYRHGTYYKSDEFLMDKARFYSEIGHLSLCNEESIGRFIPKDKIWPIDREVWDFHTGSHKVPYYNPDRLGCIFRSIENVFGSLPDNLSDLILASQIVQAEALKFWIERCRQRKFECAGILWWNMIDCWPQFSDAAVDYYYGKKLAYYYVKRAQEPVCIMVSEPEGQCIGVIAGNDSNEHVTGHYRVWDADSENALSEGRFTVQANTNMDIDEIKISDGDKKLLLIEWTITAKDISTNICLVLRCFHSILIKAGLRKYAD
jgi:beta-mannosidase